MKKYIIYKIIIIDTQKMYIGYSSKTIEDRFHKHMLNANSGIHTKFYNALLKYNFNVDMEIIDSSDDMLKAKELEIYYINFYDTYKNGYNSTKGGDGGFIVPDEKYNGWLKKLTIRSIGSNNANHSGYTDYEIVMEGIRFYKEVGLFTISNWKRWGKKNGFPIRFSACRFNGGGFNAFKQEVVKIIGEVSDIYIKDILHKENLANAIRGRKWMNNGIENKHVQKDKISEFIDNKWVFGRILKK